MSEPRTYPITEKGLQKLRDELAHLVDVKRPELADRLRKAIAQGDLSENADYADAKEQQGFVEGRIQQLEEMISGAVIIEANGAPDGVVAFGSRVTVRDDEGFEATYTLVGPAEANPREGFVSYESPLGEALVGKAVGDEFRVSAPGGDITYKILELD